ncbi:4-alpha-glucanotransferase, partial [Streptomyces sp. NPDC047970]
MGLARLAALHGVATSFSPSEGVTRAVPDRTVRAVLAALGVDTATPAALRAALERAEREAAARLLPDAVVVWQGPGGPELPASLASLPPGTELEVVCEDGAVLTPRPPAPAAAAGPSGARAAARGGGSEERRGGKEGCGVCVDEGGG